MPKQLFRHAPNRSVREQVQQKTAGLWVSLSRSEGSPDRCLGVPLAEDVPVCLPAVEHPRSGDDESTTGTPQKATPCSTGLPQSNVVPNSNKMDVLKNGNPSLGTTTEATPLRACPRQTGHAVFNGIPHSLPKLEEEGYSPNVLAQLKHARASSTNQNYDSKWKLFQGYAQKQGFNPYQTSAAQIAEFLTFLFQERKVSPSSIKGYRAAIGHILRLTNGYDPGEDQIVKMLIKSFERRCPPSKRKTPTWDLSLVLSELQNINDKEVEMPLLLAKTIFLVALASGARRGKIWALTNDLKLVKGNPDVLVIPFHPSFIFKTEFTCKSKKGPQNLEIPILGGTPQKGVCPVTSLLIYQNRVKPQRPPNQTSLFIPVNSPGSNPTKQMISANIIKAIKWAYSKKGVPLPRGIHAHNMRGVASTLRFTVGNSVEDILDAGKWTSTKNVFQTLPKRDTLSHQA